MAAPLAAAAAEKASAAAAAPGPAEARFLPLFERVKAALQLGRGGDEEHVEEEARRRGRV